MLNTLVWKRKPAVPAAIVVAHYQRLNPAGNKALHELVQKVPVWHDTLFNESLAQRALVFYAHEVPADHPDHLLTAYGRNRRLLDVAAAYLELERQGRLPVHPYIRNLQYFIDGFRRGADFPHVILVAGRVHQAVYIIDGNTRSIAAAVVKAERGDALPRGAVQPAMEGGDIVRQ